MVFQRTKLNNRSHLWELAKVHEVFTAFDLSAAERCSVETVRAAIKDWKRWGYVEKVGKRGKRDLFQITKKTGTPPVTDREGSVVNNISPEESMWFVLRKAGVFDHRDIAMQANTNRVSVSRDEARNYCQFLLEAGYLRVERKADGRGRLARYRLIKDTGPKPPQAGRVKAVYDPNLHKITVLKGRFYGQ